MAYFVDTCLDSSRLTKSSVSNTRLNYALLDIVQSFPLLSYCIVGPMSVYIYKSNM